MRTAGKRFGLVALLAALTLAGCSQEAADPGDSAGFVEGDGTSVILPVDQRKPARCSPEPT